MSSTTAVFITIFYVFIMLLFLAVWLLIFYILIHIAKKFYLEDKQRKQDKKRIKDENNSI